MDKPSVARCRKIHDDSQHRLQIKIGELHEEDFEAIIKLLSQWFEEVQERALKALAIKKQTKT